MNADQRTVQKALSALDDKEFVNVLEWVGNGWPLMTGVDVLGYFVNAKGEP